MNIICNKCGKEQDITEYSFRNKKQGIRHSKCKSCQKVYTAKHYKDNSKKYKLRAVANKDHERRKTITLVASLKKSGCIVCGELRPYTIDFHHIDPKNKFADIGSLFSRAKILEESKKCVLLCKNCHAEEHFRLRHGKDSQLV